MLHRGVERTWQQMSFAWGSLFLTFALWSFGPTCRESVSRGAGGGDGQGSEIAGVLWADGRTPSRGGGGLKQAGYRNRGAGTWSTLCSGDREEADVTSNATAPTPPGDENWARRIESVGAPSALARPRPWRTRWSRARTSSSAQSRRRTALPTS